MKRLDFGDEKVEDAAAYVHPARLSMCLGNTTRDFAAPMLGARIGLDSRMS